MPVLDCAGLGSGAQASAGRCQRAGGGRRGLCVVAESRTRSLGGGRVAHLPRAGQEAGRGLGAPGTSGEGGAGIWGLGLKLGDARA